MNIRVPNTARLAIVACALLAGSPIAFADHCDRACLLEQAELFNVAMLAHTTEKIRLAPDVQIRENTKAIALSESKWSNVKQILSEGVFADPIKGNVIEHVTGNTADGKTVYIGTRLQLANDKIKEIEINFDDGPRVNVKNLVPYDPLFDTLVPPEKRSTREQLERVITSYFKG